MHFTYFWLRLRNDTVRWLSSWVGSTREAAALAVSQLTIDLETVVLMQTCVLADRIKFSWIRLLYCRWGQRIDEDLLARLAALNTVYESCRSRCFIRCVTTLLRPGRLCIDVIKHLCSVCRRYCRHFASEVAKKARYAGCLCRQFWRCGASEAVNKVQYGGSIRRHCCHRVASEDITKARSNVMICWIHEVHEAAIQLRICSDHLGCLFVAHVRRSKCNRDNWTRLVYNLQIMHRLWLPKQAFSKIERRNAACWRRLNPPQ